MKKYLFTWAQNATRIHEGFFRALVTRARKEGRRLVVLQGRYKNPTSSWTSAQQEEEWWDERLAPYLVGKPDKQGRYRSPEIGLCSNLTLHAEVPIQPTAQRPLSGFESFTGESSAIFGHPKRAMVTVPAGTSQLPRVMWTTGAVTLPNYTDSKAGRKGRQHHVLGALAVEVSGKRFWIRNITWDRRTKSFTDLGVRWSARGPEKAPPAKTLTLGDIHFGRISDKLLEEHRRLCRTVRAEHLVVHDSLDFKARNHHETKSRKASYARKDLQVEAEVAEAARGLSGMASWARYVHVVRSNHDEALERWMEEGDSKADPLNAPYWHTLWSRAYEAYQREGKWPNMYEREARRLGCPANVRFLSRTCSLRIRGVEHGFHGDKGPSGSRGSTLGYAKLGTKTTKGHSHTPAIIDGAMSVGVGGDLDHEYNLPPDSWLVADVVLHADGKRQLIVFVGDKFAP